MQSATTGISSGVKPRVVHAGVPMRTPLVTPGFCGSFGMAFLLTVICTSSSFVCSSLPVMFFFPQIGKHQMVVCAAGHERALGHLPVPAGQGERPQPDFKILLSRRPAAAFGMKTEELRTPRQKADAPQAPPNSNMGAKITIDSATPHE